MTMPLTKLAQEFMATHLKPGDVALDATVGNGHDTLFLAEQVGPEGHVIGLDIQEAAIHVTRQRLELAGFSEHVTLVQSGHEQLSRHISEPFRGQLRGVMFNLGYLPGGNQQLITRPDTTVAALEQLMEHLGHDGLISLMVYRGHEGGDEEYTAIHRWLEKTDCPWRYPEQDRRPAHAPVLMHLGPGAH